MSVVIEWSFRLVILIYKAMDHLIGQIKIILQFYFQK
jgi:hypothetical protein